MMTIGIIDAHPIVRTGLSLVLLNEFREIRILESSGVQQFYLHYPEETLHVIIVGDTSCGSIKPSKLVTSLSGCYKDTKIVMFAEEYSNSDIVNYLRAGVNGYVSKTAGVPELLTCIRDVVKGKIYINCDTIVQFLLTRPRSSFHKLMVKKNQDRPSLTRREFEIAQYLINGLTTSSIAEQLERKNSTISSIKKNIYSKLKISNIIELRKMLRYH